MPQYSRFLTDDILIEQFVMNILDFTDDDEISQAVARIGQGEARIIDFGLRPTITHQSYRNRRYRDERTRELLRQRIVSELIEQRRPEKDDMIILGVGGSLPRGCNVSSGKTAYILIGPPASGKSGIANSLADATDSMILGTR